MSKNFILLTLLVFSLISCSEEELPIATPGNGLPMNLVGQDQTLSICGSNYILTNSNNDSVQIRYNEVLRDFFVENGISEKDFPIPVAVTLLRLDEADPCTTILKEVKTIRVSYVRAESGPESIR